MTKDERFEKVIDMVDSDIPHRFAVRLASDFVDDHDHVSFLDVWGDIVSEKLETYTYEWMIKYLQGLDREAKKNGCYTSHPEHLYDSDKTLRS